MKKTMIFAAFAALISLASCQKEDVIDNGTDKKASPVFTASIAGSTRTTVNVTDGKVAWETTDEITITDASSKSAVYKIGSIDATTGKATFVIKDGETAIGAGPYTAIYGTEPATEQTYSATPGRLYMTAPETSDNSLEFTVQCGLMKLNLTKTGESVKSIAVSSSTATYTLTCDPAQSIATAKDFYIALPAGSYNKIEITNSSDITCTLNSASGVEVAVNHIKPVTFGESKINFAPALPDGALSGKFTINADGGKVYFSKGNMYWDGDSFEFETNQYDISPSWNADHVSNFYWSKTASSAYAESYDYVGSETDVLFTNETEATPNAGFTVNGMTGVWRTLSQAEWQYLLNKRTMTYNKKRYSNAMKDGVTIDSKTYKGIFLYPDNYNGDTVSVSMTLEQINAAGIVFLPNTGFRNDGTYVDEGEKSCFYWTSTVAPDGDDGPCACRMFFQWKRNDDSTPPSLSTDFENAGYRYWAVGIRLVSDVK